MDCEMSKNEIDECEEPRHVLMTSSLRNDPASSAIIEDNVSRASTPNSNAMPPNKIGINAEPFHGPPVKKYRTATLSREIPGPSGKNYLETDNTRKRSEESKDDCPSCNTRELLRKPLIQAKTKSAVARKHGLPVMEVSGSELTSGTECISDVSSIKAHNQLSKFDAMIVKHMANGTLRIRVEDGDGSPSSETSRGLPRMCDLNDITQIFLKPKVRLMNILRGLERLSDEEKRNFTVTIMDSSTNQSTAKGNSHSMITRSKLAAANRDDDPNKDTKRHR